jgi:hypothetical protein
MPSRIVLDFKNIVKWSSGNTKKGTKVVELNSEDISLLVNFTKEDFQSVADTFIRELDPNYLKSILETLDIPGLHVSY